MATVSSLRPIKSSVSKVPMSTIPTLPGKSKPPFFTLIEPGINSAISRGLFQQVRFLVQFGNEVNERDEDRCTPLIHCSLIEDEQWGVGIARLLIEKGASIGLRDRKGLNALHHACLNNRLEIVRVYLSAVDFDVNQADALGNTALHYAASIGNEEMVKLLLETLLKYKLTVDTVNRKAVTPLMQAYKCGNAECAQLLISMGSANQGEHKGDLPICAKTAKDLRNERLAAANTKSAQRETSKENKANQHEMTLLSDITNSTRTMRVRVKSEANKRPPSGRPMSGRPKTSTRRRGESEEKLEDVDLEEGILSRAKNSERLYRAASATELRNRPDLVFNINPIQCVVNGTDRHPNVPRSGGHQASTKVDRPGSGQMRIPTSWRCEMKKLYGAFEFQFTKSFVAGVKPQPEPEASCEDTCSQRPSSALTSESMSGSMSDIASVCSRRSGMSARRAQTSNPAGDARKRKTSVAQQNKKRPQALLTLRTDSDTSSETSGSTRRRLMRDSESSDGASSSRKSSMKSKSSVLSALSKLSS